MKTIREPRHGRYHIECKNSDCAAVMICKKNELQTYGDCEGYYYVMVCPHCKERTRLTSADLKNCKQ